MKNILIIILLSTTYFSFGQFKTNYIHIGAAGGNISRLSDIDNDGDLDYITIGVYNQVASRIVYKTNDGTGEFSELKVLVPSTNSSVSKFVILDVDQDGLNDIVFIDASDFYKFKWLKNLGNENYSSPISTTVMNSGNLTDLFAIDIDNDGDTDLIQAENAFSGTFSINLNMGNSTFGPVSVINTGAVYVKKLKFYDINQDGLLDAVYTTNNAGLSNWKTAYSLNLGGGSFGPEIIVANPSSSSNIFFAFDYDNDNDLDIFYVNTEDDKIVWHENLNSTTVGPEQTIQVSNGQNIFYGVDMDVDMDGMIDIIAKVNSDLVYYKNLGGGSFSTSNSIIPDISNSGNFIVADIDNNGEEDLYFENSYFFWLKKNGMNTFTTPIGISVGVNSSDGGIIIDYDGDNKKDLLIGGGDVRWNKNRGNNVFETGKALTSPGISPAGREIKKKDLNNDGLPDIINGGHQFNALSWRRNLGNGQFTDYTTITGIEDVTQHDFEVGDLDNDGNPDVVVSSNNFAFHWCRGLGNNQFESSGTVVPGSIGIYRDIELADMNNDGFIDVLYTKSNGVAWQENLGNGSFGGELIITNLTDLTSSIKIVDIDQDGRMDIVSTSKNDNKLAWYKNLGNNQFAVQQIISTQVTEPIMLKSGDINSDGRVDLVVANTNEISWFENLGGGQFSSKLVILNDMLDISSITLDEIDDDGDLDILVTSTLHETRLLINQYVHGYQVSGQLFYDKDQNGIFDNEDIGMPNLAVLTSPSSSYSYTYENGNFITNFNDTIGTYTLYPEVIQNWNITSTPSSYQINVTPDFTNQTGLNFGFYPDSLYNEITPMIFSFGSRCNDTINYWIDLKNSGTLANSGIIELTLDPLAQYYSSNVPVDSIVNNSIYWHYDSLDVFHYFKINLSVIMPDFQSIGSVLADSLKVFVLDDQGAEIDEFDVEQSQILTCAYDPNDKTVSPKGLTSLGHIPTDTEWLNYTIRFQNTGNDTAQNVRIEDVLDNNIEQFIVLSSSHTLRTLVDESNKVSFMFDNINLPDSNVNVLGSQGYVAYKAKLKNNLPDGTQISNVADIYFDFNPAIVTNTVLNTLHDEEDDLSLNELTKNSKLIIYPNPFSDFVILELMDKNSSEEYYLDVYNMLGQKLINKIPFKSDKIQLSGLEFETGVLLFKLYSESGEVIHLKSCISLK